jgi:hypothetical protein
LLQITRQRKGRAQIAALKADLEVRHRERNQLRRELDEAKASLQHAQASEPGIRQDDTGTSDIEDTAWSEEGIFAVQPFRMPVLGRLFAESLAKIPDPVRRKAVKLFGQLAAGEESAFRGCCLLVRGRTLLRQRVGREYRLLCRMSDDRLEALVLIHRRDLERTIAGLV